MRTVFITGAGRGLGLELTKVFLRNGWRAIAACRDSKELPADIATHQNILALDLDVTDQRSLEACAEKIKGMPVDVLINNAGIYDSASVDEEAVITGLPEITKVFQVNSIGPKFVSEALLSNLQAGSEKLAVTISSSMGTYEMLDEYHAKHWPYCASKAAVNYIMTAFNKEHPEIKVSLINPGWMKTSIGGKEAPLEPSFSAEKIFALIADHQNLLHNTELVDYNGGIITTSRNR